MACLLLKISAVLARSATILSSGIRVNPVGEK